MLSRKTSRVVLLRFNGEKYSGNFFAKEGWFDKRNPVEGRTGFLMDGGYETQTTSTNYKTQQSRLSISEWQLDGWNHITKNMFSVSTSLYRVPEAMDKTNWMPLTEAEKELFDKRLEFGAKNRRRFWEMRYNPKTEGYFCGQTSDRAWAQHDWVNSVWFEQASSNNRATYWVQLISFTIGCVIAAYYMQSHFNQNLMGPGMPNAPATDMVNFEIEVIDMARNNYTPIGYYRNGEFKPHQKE